MVLVRDSVAVWTERPLSVLYLRTRPRSVNRIGRRVLEECEYGDDPAMDRRSNRPKHRVEADMLGGRTF